MIDDERDDGKPFYNIISSSQFTTQPSTISFSFFSHRSLYHVLGEEEESGVILGFYEMR